MPDEYKIPQEGNSKASAIFTPGKMPTPILNKVKAELDHMQKQGIISPVEQPTEWCPPMATVSKPDGSIRVCVDLAKLNTTEE